MLVCKLTGNIGKPIKSHIIPASFFEVHNQKYPPLIMGNKSGSFPKISRQGVYDQEIVIQEGEDILKRLDQYGYETLVKNKKDFEPIVLNSEVLGFKLVDYDYARLKLFVLSILWRASVSKKAEFSKVSLGPHEEIFRKMILDHQPCDPEVYSVQFFIFDEKIFELGSALFPAKEKIEEINYYRVYLREFIALVKVDRRKSLKCFSPFIIRPNSALPIVKYNYKGSSEERVIKDILSKNDHIIPAWFSKATMGG